MQICYATLWQNPRALTMKFSSTLRTMIKQLKKYGADWHGKDETPKKDFQKEDRKKNINAFELLRLQRILKMLRAARKTNKWII